MPFAGIVQVEVHCIIDRKALYVCRKFIAVYLSGAQQEDARRFHLIGFAVDRVGSATAGYPAYRFSGG